jgi:hypothetical protein
MASACPALVIVVGRPVPRPLDVPPAIELADPAGPPQAEGWRRRPSGARGSLVDLYA